MDGVGEVIEPEEHRRARLAARAATYTDRVAHLRALRDEATTEQCSHNVRRAHCADHRNAETEPTEEPA